MVGLTVLQFPGQYYWLEIETTGYLLAKQVKKALLLKLYLQLFRKVLKGNISEDRKEADESSCLVLKLAVQPSTHFLQN